MGARLCCFASRTTKLQLLQRVFQRILTARLDCAEKSAKKVWIVCGKVVCLHSETIMLQPKTNFPYHIHDALDINR